MSAEAQNASAREVRETVFGFPKAGEARVVTDGVEAYVIAWMPLAEARKVANGLAVKDFTREHLAEVIGNAAVLTTMPGRISRADTSFVGAPNTAESPGRFVGWEDK